jgi:hypothetical protein
LRRVSKDGAASWFEAREDALPTALVDDCNVRGQDYFYDGAATAMEPAWRASRPRLFPLVAAERATSSNGAKR